MKSPFEPALVNSLFIHHFIHMHRRKRVLWLLHFSTRHYSLPVKWRFIDPRRNLRADLTAPDGANREIKLREGRRDHWGEVWALCTDETCNLKHWFPLFVCKPPNWQLALVRHEKHVHRAVENLFTTSESCCNERNRWIQALLNTIVS